MDTSAESGEGELCDGNEDAADALVADAEDLRSIWSLLLADPELQWALLTCHDDIINIIWLTPLFEV